ncbi:alpha-L-fucosidase [Prolixibacteraceae bacterium Z1-6]|uniref:alpha-L-fucosidase n=1 Tax=Draconibacterium aestuarii TaxID=2998507 RepID=A0A9X3F2J6_9BACT|nr:alpha-L-fucosidase [Prolixibacteraceae bacterium Z1-6]
MTMKTTFLFFAFLFFLPFYSSSKDKSTNPIPSKVQLHWLDTERIMFVHFGPATWQHREYDNLTTPLERINPTQLNTDQWCEVAKSWDAKMILFVAKHVGGFCWWDTQTTHNNSMNTPIKRDILREVSESCKKYGLDLGVYVYPGDGDWGAGIGSGGITTDPSKQEAYNKVLRTQLKEVWNNYGPIREIWFDGSCKIYIDDILTPHLDEAVVLQSPLTNLRWVGNEDGIAPDPNWATLDSADLKTGVSTAFHSTSDGDAYAPIECDVPFLKNGGHKWFWAPGTDSLMMTREQFVDLYYKSVGRGSVLLLNSTPDTTGLIPSAHVARYKEFGEEIRRRFDYPVGSTSGNGKVITLKLKQSESIDHVVLQEKLEYGQRVLKYQVETSSDAKNWQKVVEGTSIGNKKIDFLNSVEACYIRLTILESKDKPRIRTFAVYHVGVDMELNEQKEEIIRLGGWDQDTFGKEFSDYEIDLTPYVNEIGEYELFFRTIARDRSVRGSGLEFKDWKLNIYGQEHPELIKAKPYRFFITRSQQTLDDFKTIFKVQAKSTGGSSIGDIQLRRITY